MKQMKRMLALVLALVMIVGVLPMSVLAEELGQSEWANFTNTSEGNTHYLFFATDRHANTSVIGNIINNMESAIGENKLEYLGLGGDMVGSGNSHPTYNSSTVLSEVTGATSSLNANNVDIVAGVHDTNVNDDAGIVLPYQDGCGLLYEGEDYYVYGVEEYCISEESNESNWSAQAQAFVDWANGSSIDKSKVIIVLSHYPLHAQRNDNHGAYYWHQALNKVATGSASGGTVSRNIVFFHGHNHTTDSKEYVYNVGDSMSIQNGSSTTSGTIYYTYATAGYLNQNKKATLVTITDGTITLTKYSTSGSGTAMTSVTRVGQIPQRLRVTGKTNYTVGDSNNDTIVAPSKVEVEFLNTSTNETTTEEIISGYELTKVTDANGDEVTLTNNQFTTAGTYNLIYTCTIGSYQAKATLTVTVKAATTESNGNTVHTYDGINYIGATGEGLTSITAEYTYVDNAELMLSTFDNGTGIAYDISLEGHTDGSEVTYQFALDETVPAQNLALYYVSSDNEPIPIAYQLVEDDGITMIQFTSANVGTFIYGTVNVPEGYTYVTLEVTNNGPEKYLVNDSFDLYLVDVVAIYENEAGETFERLLYELDGEYITDGYTWSWIDMTTAGTKTITVTYGDKTAEFTVEVYNKRFPDANTGVSVEVTVPGATEIKVEDVSSTNGTVTAAVGHLLSNYVAYDIELSGYNDGEKVTVTLPVPQGVENPVVYYVSDDGKTVQNMGATKNADGTVSFETDHFSVYTVGESTDIEVPDPETATGTGTFTTTTTKTVYVLTSSISSGKSYLIVNGSAAGSYYALANNSGSVAATGVTVKTDSTIGTYIELDDATDELWTVASGHTFQNGSYYLRYNDGLGLSTSNSTNWSYSSNRLSYRSGKSTYYLRYYNSRWTTTSSSSSATSIYFYVPTEVEIKTETTGSGTYSIAGNPDEITKVVVEGTTATLGSTLTFAPESDDATTTDTSTTATYTVADNGDPNGIISGISGNTVTFTGNYGKALVKVSYESDFGEVTNYIVVTATAPTYTLDITSGGNVVTGTTITEKGITAGQTLQLGTQIQFVDEDGAETIELPDGATLEWHIPEEYQKIATIDHETGLLTFKGVDGAFYVTATLTVDGKDYTVGVNISASTSNYSNPNDGTEDFPEYPNEGAIRFDKTATAVGNFSETGITQIELSMTGVPYTTGSEIDVVIMLDMTGSMSTTAMTAAEESAIAFAEQIVKNTDGSYNSNRVAVLAFNSGSSSPYTLWSMGVVTEDTWESFCTNVRTASDKQVSGGTPYDEALEKCQSVLQAAKTDGIGNDRQQFCVFVSDGGPTSFKYITNYDAVKAGTASSYTTGSASASGGSNQSDSNFATIATYTHEYYSTLMKDDGVTMYSVLTGLVAANYPNCTKILQNIASDSSKAYVVEDGDDTSSLTNAFTNIAKEIMQAATDVTVEDKITDEYTMIFDIPTGSKEIAGLDSQEFYIEFLKYTLDENHERTGTGTSVTKLYLKNTNGVLSAASDKNGTAYAAPVFENKTIGDKGTLYYWTTDANYASKAALSYSDGTKTYYFIPYGIKATDEGYDATLWFNMTSGAYATGTIDSTTNMSQNLIIATPYFVYNADTRMLYWTVDKIDTTEYALRYFLYLDNSATEIGTDKETDPGSYKTNEHAYLTYTNFKGNDCRYEFVKPQMTWSGAQVSYVFYLVNAQGQPINKSGQVVDFANAVFVTDIYTEDTVWNKGEDGKITADSQLSIDWLASKLLPSDYAVYDENAGYELHVYGDHTGASIFDYFTIEGSTAADISNSLNNRLDLETTATTVSLTTTKVYNTKAGTKITGYGTYTSKATSSIDNETVLNNFDFYNTTVAFAVVWQPKLVEDTVVVDFGLDVIINVVQNDILQNKVTGIGVGNSAYGNIAMNTGVSTTSKLGTAALTIDGNTISIENETSIRFSQGDMEFKAPVVFYYETPVEFWEGSDPTEGFMYSKVTVIPATTVYYEDEYVDLNVQNQNEDKTWGDIIDGGWTTVGTTTNATQQQDRPGQSLISNKLDADNNYGYDEAYKDMSMYSLGSAAMINVTTGKRGVASFTFYGTGFDIISLTSNTTGTITVKVVNDTTGSTVKTLIVDTYYGYSYGYCQIDYVYTETGWQIQSAAAVDTSVPATGTDSWPASPEVGATHTVVGENWYPNTDNTDNSLYQIPVMKVEGLTYDKYTVTITAAYSAIFDHDQACTCGVTGCTGCYNFYLDAIRIYDPTGVVSGSTDNDTDGVVSDAYDQDGEGWPEYTELRNEIIDGETVTNLSSEYIEGAVFFDDVYVDGIGNTSSVTDYTNYGPNNEVYLVNGQGIAFKLNATHLTDKYVASIQLGVKAVNGAGQVTITSDTKQIVLNINTATDMYYDITELNGLDVVIECTGTAMISLTNIKVTYTTEEPETQVQTVETNSTKVGNNDLEVAGYSLMSLRSSAPAISTMATTAEETTETTEAVETETYLLSVNAETVAFALQVLNAEEEETEPEEPVVPEEPSEPEVPETPEEPSKPEKPEKPEKPGKPGKPEKPGKPGKPEKPGKPGRGDKGHNKKAFDDQPAPHKGGRIG